MGGGDHLLLIAVQVLLGLAIFSFLEYSIRTWHAPTVVNRRAKLVCAAGLMIAVTGMIVLMYHSQTGVVLTVLGSALTVGTMTWLEVTYRHGSRLDLLSRPASPAEAEANSGDVSPADILPVNDESPADAGPSADSNAGSSPGEGETHGERTSSIPR